MNFTLSSITEKQKLIIAKGLLDYQFIMNNWRTNSSDFQDVYYEFYLKARWAKMANTTNQKDYFDLMHNSTSKDLITIIEDFEKTTGSYEFSICSKLLHTINPSSPIYDSKVRNFLTKETDLDLWYYTGRKPKAQPLDKIKNDWEIICNWYNKFLASADGRNWINWFDTNFPDYKSISDIKKIDSIIFATN